MMQVWPFRQRDTLIEALQWRTDVIRSKGAEQRFALRQAPRTVHNLKHRLSEQEYGSSRAMVRSNADFLVPTWDRPAAVSGISPGTSVAIDFDETDLDLEDGDAALLWTSSSSFEHITVESITSTGIIAEAVLNSWPSATLLALKPAQAPQGLQPQRPAGYWISDDIAMEVTDSRDISFSDYPKYRGHDLVTDCPVVASASFNEPILWPVDTVDNEVGVPRYLRNRNHPDARFMMRWHQFTRESKYALRQFLHSRRGRWKAFWLSSFGRDLLPALDISADDTTVRVFALPGLTDLGEGDFDIEIKAATIYQRQITSVSFGSEVDGKPTLVLAIDSALGADVAVAEIQRISFLRCVRFDADRIELEHRAAGGMAVSVPCIEVLP
jgi:hypothetical protein